MPYSGYVEPEERAEADEKLEQETQRVNERVELVMQSGDQCGTFDDDEFNTQELELLTTQNLLDYADRNGCSTVEYVLNWRFREYIAEQERN